MNKENYKSGIYFGIPFTTRVADNWINASEFCRLHGTTFEDWIKSPSGRGFLTYFFSSVEFRPSELIEISLGAYYISPLLIVGLGSSLSKEFATRANNWGRANMIPREKEIGFTYTVDENASGVLVQVMTFYPVKRLHVQADITRDRAKAAKEARSANMSFSSKVIWVESQKDGYTRFNVYGK